MLVALLFALQSVAAPSASGDVLDELIAKTSELKSFTAKYEMTSVTTDEGPAKTQVIQTRIDFQAPDKLRLEMGIGPDIMSQWLIDGVMTMRCEGDHPVHARIDMRALFAESAAIRRALDDMFPPTKATGGVAKSAAQMHWWFDESTQKANFNLVLAMDEAADTPLGWLTKLRTKGEKFVVAGDQLLFDNDGHFKVALSKTSGVVETLDGKSPRGNLHVQLQSFERDVPIDEQRFAPPTAALDGSDVSDALRKGIATQSAASLRERIYRKIAGATGDGWSDSERTKVVNVLRVHHEYTLNGAFDDLRKWARKSGGDFGTWLHQHENDGRPADELSSERAAQIAKLNETLDKQIGEYSARLAVPANSPPFPRGDELLKLEREIVSKTFDELIRAPIVHDFEEATKLAHD